MRASAFVVGEHVGGRTRCTTLRSDPPLTFRQTSAGLTWVGTAAGPVGGDELRLSLRVEAGATLDVGSAGASIVLPGVGGSHSQLHVDASLSTGAALRWHPEPTVLAAGADHMATTAITLAHGADLIWVDELVLGRHREAPGRLSSRLVVDGPSGPVLRTGLEIGAAGWDGPAVTDARRAHAQVLLAGAPAERVEAITLDDVDWTLARLTVEAALITIVASEPRHMRAAVARLLESCRASSVTDGAWHVPERLP